MRGTALHFKSGGEGGEEKNVFTHFFHHIHHHTSIEGGYAEYNRLGSQLMGHLHTSGGVRVGVYVG